MGPAIELRGVSKVYPDAAAGEVVALRDLTLSVAEGETLCLLGTSGSGKTTALKAINRLVEPTTGEVRVGGEDVRSKDVIALRRGMGYVVQSGALFPNRTVAGNVGLLARLEGWERERVAARVAELLELVNLPAERYAERWPRELSGGERQRVGVARALVLDPPIVLMDEPFGALDPITRRELRAEFRALEQRVRKTIVLVTHDVEEALELGDRIALLDGGRLVQAGTSEELFARPASAFVSEFLRGHAPSVSAEREAERGAEG